MPELAEVTTKSLPALRKYTTAEQAIFVRGDFDRGLQLLREAVQIDTGFAMAYMDIGSVYSRYAPGQRQLATAYFQKAYDARDRATAHDRAEVEISYWGVGPTGTKLEPRRYFPGRFSFIHGFIKRRHAIESRCLGGPDLKSGVLFLVLNRLLLRVANSDEPLPAIVPQRG
jgi:hypothetical protein